MNKDEAVAMLNDVGERSDSEISHIDADDILCAYLRSKGQDGKDVADAFESARDRVGFWYA